MNKIEKTVTEYEIDSVWSIVVEHSNVTKFHLLNKMSGTSKVVSNAPGGMEDIDTVVEQMIKDINKFQEDLVFDMQLNPKHMVDKMSDVWRTCDKESEFITNITYMILGIIVKAYNDMVTEDDGFPFDKEDVNVAIMTTVQRIGTTLMSVEHKHGTTNLASKDRVESLF